MILTGKLPILAIPIALAFAWPFTGTETVMVMTSLGGMAVAIIGALKASAAKDAAGVAREEAIAAKTAVNGHLAKLEKEQDKAKSDRDAEFDRLLQVVKDAARAEGAETARKAAELLAAKVAEGVAKAAPVVLQPAPAAPVSTGEKSRIGEAITELKAAADETSVAADKTVDIVDKQTK